MSLKKIKTRFSPWITIGISLVLIIVVIIQTIINYNREKKYMSQLLMEKGGAIINAFEAGTKTGMMGNMGNQARLQTLIEQTASQPDIRYIALVNKSGVILAHNNRQKIGTRFNLPDFKNYSLDKPHWRIVKNKNGTNDFEVFKTFLPDLKYLQGMSCGEITAKHDKRRNWHMRCSSPAWMNGMNQNEILNPETRPIIFIGMDIQPFQVAMTADLHHNIIMICLILAIGMAGLISLFWAQNYTRSRKLLQDTRLFASEIVTYLPVGIAAMDTNNRIVYINKVACTLLNIKMNKSKNRHAEGLLPGKIWELHDKVKNGNSVVEKEVALNSGQGRIIPVAVSATNIKDDDGNLIGFMFVLKDLSEIRLLEGRSRQNEKLAAIGNLASGIAHEIRNPLSSIKGYVTFFGSLFDKGSENQKAAVFMAEEVDRVNRVISELLEFAGPSDLKFKTIKASDIIDHSIRIIEHEARSSGVDIVKEINPELPDIHADLDRLTQVMLNLYINAIQAMENGGGELRVKMKALDNSILIEISDTGKGIPDETRNNIFNPYFTTKKNGTGLGLAIVHKIIENHGGSIQVETRENAGATFTIILPVKEERKKIS